MPPLFSPPQVVTATGQASPMLFHYLAAIRLKYMLWEEVCMARGTLHPTVGRGSWTKKRKSPENDADGGAQDGQRNGERDGQHGGEHDGQRTNTRVASSTSPPAAATGVAPHQQAWGTRAVVGARSSKHNPNRRLNLEVMLPHGRTVVFETFRTTAAANLVCCALVMWLCSVGVLSCVCVLVALHLFYGSYALQAT